MPSPGLICIGNQTAFSAASITEPFEYALANKFDAFEWFPDRRHDGMGWSESDLSASLRADICRTARSRQIRQSVHVPWTANPMLAETEPCLRRELELAGDLGASMVVIHFHAEQGVQAYANAVLPVLRQAASQGIKIAIENTVNTGPEDFNRLFAALQNLHPPGSPPVGMCFDLGHANLFASTRNDYLEYLDQLGPDVPIIHLHLHENWGDADSHLALFTGPAARDAAGVRGLVERLRKRGFAGSAILEQWPSPTTLLNQARDSFLRLWNEAPPGRDTSRHPKGSALELSRS